jgi:hypothetical protein
MLRQINIAAGTWGVHAFELDHDATGYQLNRTGGHHVTMYRCTASEMMLFLDGFAAALDLALSNKIPRLKEPGHEP